MLGADAPLHERDKVMQYFDKELDRRRGEINTWVFRFGDARAANGRKRCALPNGFGWWLAKETCCTSPPARMT